MAFYAFTTLCILLLDVEAHIIIIQVCLFNTATPDHTQCVTILSALFYRIHWFSQSKFNFISGLMWFMYHVSVKSTV